VSIAGVQSANRHLKAETSKSWTLGLVVEPAADLSAQLDFYSIRIDGQIVTGGDFVNVRGSNFSPIDQVQPNGSTALVVPPVAPIAYGEISYINANSTLTNGVELGLRLRRRIGDVGELRSDFMVTTMTRYDMTIGGVTYHLAGTHGPFSFSGDTGNPRTRIQWTNTLAHGPWQLTGTLNYIGSFGVTDPSAVAFTGTPQDTCLEALTNSGGMAGTAYANALANGRVPAALKCRVRAFATVDAAGRYAATKQLSVQASILNLFNAGAPRDWATYGGSGAPYNPALHLAGAVGRFCSLGATYTF
jgi:iron complex outermembrane receptor protein